VSEPAPRPSSEPEPPERFDRAGAEPDPFKRFERWWAGARAASPFADAMVVASASPAAVPSARTVLLRAFDRRGFVFFTNYESPKATELAANPQAALVLHWPELHRQVRATGTVTRVSREESEAYFATRPAGHRLAAWSSPQSSVISGREVLEEAWAQARARFPGEDVPLPLFWGGLRVAPETFEFWQGRDNRLHDRVRYLRRDNDWLVERLAP
jgi:pyridoxamine 5'-phosphate oxidase